MAWNDKLVSVIILTYKSFEMLPRALNSVFVQDYPHIEIIISDDGSDEFDENAIREYIEDYKTENIESYKIVHSAENTGTGQNVRRALEVMTGDYYLNFGSDDALYDNTVISDYIRTLALRNFKPLLVSGCTAMYSNDELTKYYGTIPSRNDVEILIKEDPAETLNALASRCAIATVSTCYSKDFPKAVDAYDTIYKYYEDYPTFLRMARKGYTPVFVDRIMTKHAGGGIANGSKNKEMAFRFYQDRKLMWETEFEPYRDMFSKNSQKANKKRRKLERNIYKRSSGAVSFKEKVEAIKAAMKDFFRKRSKKVSHYFQMGALSGIVAILAMLSKVSVPIFKLCLVVVPAISSIAFFSLVIILLLCNLCGRK